MLAIAVSLLFALAAFAALAVIRSSLLAGIGRARLILAELDELERRARVTRSPPARSRPQRVLQPRFAAA